MKRNEEEKKYIVSDIFKLFGRSRLSNIETAEIIMSIFCSFCLIATEVGEERLLFNELVSQMSNQFDNETNEKLNKILKYKSSKERMEVERDGLI